jgi:hypothetical protein
VCSAVTNDAPCGGISGYACRTPADTCGTADDCCNPEPNTCNYSPELGHWECQAAMFCNG